MRKEIVHMSNHFLSVAVAATAVLSFPVFASAELVYGLTNFQNIVSFDSTTRTVSTTVPAAGFSIFGEFLRSIDTRPANGMLYGLSNMDRLFVINPTTGTSTLVGGPTSTSFGNATTPSIDFNPTVDRLRVVTRTAQNGRINPNDGTLVDGDTATAGVQPDPTLAYIAGDAGVGTTPAAVGVGYTNSRPGATATTLYTLEANRDFLTIQNPATGTLTSVGGGLGVDLGATSGFTGFDISSTDNTALLTTGATLYTINLASGAASLQGAITGLPGFEQVSSIAIATIVPEPASLGLLTAGAMLGLRRRRR